MTRTAVRRRRRMRRSASRHSCSGRASPNHTTPGRTAPPHNGQVGGVIPFGAGPGQQFAPEGASGEVVVDFGMVIF